MGASDAPAAFGVLYVCTGNICRSPLAERLTGAELARRLGPAAPLVQVSSVGTHGLSGHEMYAEAATVLERAGGDPAGFRARRMEIAHVTDADLILTATREHRAAVVRLAPRASRRTFTIREFARLAGEVDPAALPTAEPLVRLRAAVAEASGYRGLVAGADPDDDDVPDPYGGPAAGYDESARLIGAAMAPTMDLLVAAAAPVPVAPQGRHRHVTGAPATPS